METVSFLRAMSVVAGFAAASLAVPELVGAIRRVRAARRRERICQGELTWYGVASTSKAPVWT